MNYIYDKSYVDYSPELSLGPIYCPGMKEKLLYKQHSSPPLHKRKSLTSKCSLATASFILSIVCLLTMVSFAGICFFVFDSPTDPPGDEVCLPCIQVTPDPLSEPLSPLFKGLDVRHDEENDEDYCCARTTAQFAAIFKLIIKRQQEVKKIAYILESAKQSSSVNESEASAHLLFKPTSDENLESLEPAILHWKSPDDSALSHVRGGLQFQDNVIYILSSGLYFIYCQVLYNRVDMTSDDGIQIISSYVIRNSFAYPASSGIVLKSRHTRNNRENDRHSTYVGGLFYMQAGDQLFVKVIKPSLISNDESGSFFGLFRVGR